MKKNIFKEFTKGLFKENPILIIMLGLCSCLAVSTDVSNALGMSLGFSFVLIISELLVSIFRKIIPNEVRIPIFLIFIAVPTTIVDLVMKAYFPSLSKSMGVFIPLIVVNCIVLGRIEAFSYKKNFVENLMDSLGMALGYSWVIIVLSIIREIFGKGTFLGIRVMPEVYQPMSILTSPPGGFFLIAVFIALLNGILKRRS
ncbi:MAG TPA: electron transport complex subunit RsxE [Caldisericia bacterium]|nr:electron transport complex subunit RsxE [Caldisericia bacterium]HOL83260.1 electron transport complex subunit RsxE [Caldisericia bacterium]HPP43633.1 electron transport complex subunit RsxE [Caldisericia bacterium]HQJ57042.1 electron transport complex subunit RsxE [Caldisericia bacterium]